MRELRVKTAGIHASVQDRGRPGQQWLGIPEGGALDRDALMVGNALVGNPLDAAAIEVCLGGSLNGGFSFELLTDARIALTGTVAGVFSIEDNNTGLSMKVGANRSIDVVAGRVIRLTSIPDSNTALIAVSGGIALPLFYGSCATSPSAKIGGIDGRTLIDGDILPLGQTNIKPANIKPANIEPANIEPANIEPANIEQANIEQANIEQANIEQANIEQANIGPANIGDASIEETPELAWEGHIDSDDAGVIRCVRGPQDDYFTTSALQCFFSQQYKVSPALSRMGMRLEGAILKHNDGADIPSDGIVTGSIQVPGSGLPIIMLADHASTGGYPKIATVISADIPKLARLRPHDGLRFEEVCVNIAETTARSHHKHMTDSVSALKPATPMVDLAALYGLNDD